MHNSPESAQMTWDPAVGHPHRKQILAVCCIALVLVVVAVSSLNVALPTMSRELQTTSSQMLWIVDSYAIVFAGFLLPAGALGDRFGRRGALLTGLSIFAVAAVFASQSKSPEFLIAMRSIMGIGAAFVMPATLSIIVTVFAPLDRPKAIATWAGFAGAGGAIGPVMTGVLLNAGFWWGSVFFINLPIAALAIFMVTTRVPTSRDPDHARLDLIGGLISIVMFGSLLFGIIEGPHHGWASPIVLGAFGVSLVTGALFIWWELRVEHPMLDPRFFKIPAFTAGAAVVTSVFFGMFGTFFMMTQYLQGVKGFSPLQAGLAVLPNAMTTLLVSPRSPRVVAAIGARRTIVIGMTLVGSGLLLNATLGPSSSYLQVATALVMMAAGMGLSTASAATSIVTSLPEGKAGVASAVNDVTREVGGALGIAVLGSIMGARFASAMKADTPPEIIDALPPELADRVGESIGMAEVVTEALPPDLATQFQELVQQTFSNAVSSAYLVAAIIIFGLTLTVGRSVPQDPR